MSDLRAELPDNNGSFLPARLINHPFAIPRSERLHLKREIERLFSHPRKSFAFPYRLLFGIDRKATVYGVRFMVIVPKRVIKLAVNRHAQKRRVREAYRLQVGNLRKLALQERVQISLAFILISNEQIEWQRGHRAIARLLKDVETALQAHQDDLSGKSASGAHGQV